jgi:hypothetical protein
MDPALSPALIGVLLVPLVIMMAAAIVTEQWQRRRDRADDVLMTWDDLRLTRSHLMVGFRSDAPRIPLAGLEANVGITASPGQADDACTVHLTIEGAGHNIHRRQPYSYGASGGAQMFAIKFNSLSGHRRAAPHQHDTAADVAPSHRSDRHAA